MPETTIAFRISDVDDRISMRGTVARLREHPLVVSVEATDDSTQEEPRWLVNHAEASEFSRTTQERELAGILNEHRLYEYIPPPPPDPEQQSGYLRRAIEAIQRLGTSPSPDEIISRAIERPEGRSLLAQTMIAPLRTRMDYQSIGRRAFLVEQLPEGAMPFYQGGLPIRQELTVLPADNPQERTLGWAVEEHIGMAVFNPRAVSRLTADRVMVPEIAANPTVRLEDIRQRRFDLMTRHPPAPPPEWVAVGVWVRSKKNSEDMWLITGVDAYNVTLEVWRGVYRTATVAFSSLTSSYEPCLAPAIPPSRFDRELEV